MKKTLAQSALRGSVAAVAFCATIALITTAYSAFTSLSSVQAWDTLTVGHWTQIKDNFDDLNGRVSKLAFSGTNVGIGVTPTQKLSVAWVVESTAGGFKFPDGTTQTTAVAGWSVDFKTVMNAAADHVYSVFGLWWAAQPPFTQHYTNTSAWSCGSYNAYPAYPSCPTGWTSMGTRQSQYTSGNCYCDEFGGCTQYGYRTSQRYCKLTW